MTNIAKRIEAFNTSIFPVENYQALIDFIPGPAFIIDKNNFCRYINLAACRFFRYKNNEIIGKNIDTFITNAKDFNSILKTAKDSSYQIKNLEWQFLNKAERPIWGEFNLRFLPDENVVFFINDIQKRKQLEEEILKLPVIFEAAHDAVLSVSLDGKILSCNSIAEKTFEYTTEEMIGQNISIIFPTHLLNEKDEILNKIKCGESVYQYETVRLKKNGTTMNVSLNVSPIKNVNGEIIGSYRITRDITESKLSQTEIFQKDEQLRQSQKVEAVGRLAGGIAHDFNNFLAVIMLHVDMLDLQLPVDSSLRYRIQEIKGVTNSAAGVVKQLLAFGRKQTLQPIPIVLNQIVNEFIKVLRPLVGEDVEIQLDLDKDLGVCFVDANQVIQVLMNLAVNARDAMPNGGILKIKTENVKFDKDNSTLHKSQSFGSYIELTVSDNGIGMESEVQSHIFEPFFTTKEVGKGTGLGLATVYGIVKQSKGFIWVESGKNQGTIFKIQFPRIDQPTVLGKTEKSEAIPRGNETILLVEDEEPLRRATVEILTILGYQILEAGNAAEAIKIIQSRKGQIDLLLTDVVMPKMNGKQLAEEVNILHPETIVLFMSGYNDDIIAHHGILEANVNFLGKPFSPNTLATKIREIINN